MGHKAFIALGTNLGDRLANLEAALRAMPPALRVVRRSRVYQTPPWGYTDQPAFLNQVIEAETDLTPQDLLVFLKDLERRLGRLPTFQYGPRLIDLDILFYDDLVLESPVLVLPHPKLHERAFVLAPLNDLAPDLRHPLLGMTVQELQEEVDTQGIHPHQG